MNIRKKQIAFTLVELIVVIVILSILSTIAFMSFSSYSSSARDSTRMADISNLTKSIEVFSTRAGTYPEPSGNLTSVVYSGTTVYSVGTVGDNLIRTLGTVSKKPLDPQSQQEYSYSLSRNQYTKSYEISSSIEGTFGFNVSNPFENFDPKAMAATNPTNSYIKGVYNGIILRAFTGGIYYAITSPTISISNSFATGGTLDILSLSGKLIYANRPSSGIGFTPQIVWSGSQLVLSKTQPFIDSVQSSFTGLVSEPKYNPILTSSGNAELDLGKNIFITYLGGSVNETSFKFASDTILVGQSTTIGDNCVQHPTSYSGSDNSIATITGNSIYGAAFGTVTVTATGGNCTDNGPKTFTVTVPVGCGISYGKTVGSYGFSGALCSGGTVTTWSGTGGVTTPSLLSWNCSNGASCQAPFGNNGGLCDTYDLLIGNLTGNYMVTSMCNVGTNTAGTSTGSYGSYYQWQALVSGYPSGSFGNWGGTGDDPNTNTEGAGTTPAGRKGPCPTGWHVPSSKEWNNIASLGGWLCNGACPGIGASMSTALKLPKAGFKWSGGDFNIGSYLAIWSSSPYGANASNVVYDVSGNYFNPTNNIATDRALSVRCFKD